MKNEEILFSLIIPIYNGEEYLKKCLNSITNQKYQNIEILLINDGSTDNTKEICTKYVKKDPRFKLYNKKNNGVAAARNFGLKKAKGKFITFFDIDDYIENNYFEKIIKIINKYDCDLINFGFYSEVNNGKKTSKDKISIKSKYYKNKNQIKKDLVYLWDTHMLYNVWNKIYLNSIIIEHNLQFPNYNFGEDMEFNKNYLKYVNKFYNCSDCYYHYIKERKNSITSKYNQNLFNLRLKEYHDFNNYFKNQGLKPNEYIEFSSRRFIERVLGCIENICAAKLRKKEKKHKIKEIITNKTTKETINNTKPKSKKIKILLIPLKLKSVCLTYFEFKIISKIRKLNPEIFNKLKNRR